MTTTSHDQSDAERRRALTRLGAVWPNGWTRVITEEYALAVRDTTPKELDDAVTRAVATRTIRPAPAQLRDLIIEARRERRDAARADRAGRDPGDGQGCPQCRSELGGQAVDSGRHPLWAGDGTLICCHEHNVMWRGSTHRPDEADPGDLAPGEWLARALGGEYGGALRQVAERGATPAQVILHVTPRPLDAALLDATTTPMGGRVTP